MPEYAIFDLDGTITKEQTQLLLLDYLIDKKIISNVFYFKIFAWFIFYKAGIVKNPKPAMEYAFKFLAGQKTAYFEELVGDFFEAKLKKFIFPEIVDIINEHKAMGRELVLVSNAISPVAKKMCRYLGIKYCICTELEEKNGFYTGKIAGEMVYGKSKAEYLLAKNIDLANAWFYTDHVSDLPLLLAAKKAFVVNPDRLLFKEAQKRKWPVLKFKK